MKPETCTECGGYIIWDKDLQAFGCKECGILYKK